jgi:hypothetical protein
MIDRPTLGLPPADSAGYGTSLSPGWPVIISGMGRLGGDWAVFAGPT